MSVCYSIYNLIDGTYISYRDYMLMSEYVPTPANRLYGNDNPWNLKISFPLHPLLPRLSKFPTWFECEPEAIN